MITLLRVIDLQRPRADRTKNERQNSLIEYRVKESFVPLIN